MQKEIKFSDYFRASIDLVETAKIDYLVIGGVAVGVWGNIRVTEDLDLIIFIPRKNVKVILEKSKTLGFRFDERIVLKQAEEAGVFKIFYKDYHLDFLIASIELEKSALKRKIKITIFNREVCVPSKEDLLLLKIIAGRPKDMLDAEGIVNRQKERLDIKYLESQAQRLCDEAEDMRIWNELQRLLALK